MIRQAASLKTVAVIGAGIIGSLSALRLAREGFRVVLIDPGPVGQGASCGNAGCFSPSSIVPLSGPGTLGQVPGWLVDPTGPLAIRWSYLPRLLPWLTRFVRAGRGDRVARQAAALASLTAPCLPLLRPWLDEIGAGSLVRSSGSLLVYRSDAGWLADAGARELRRRHGIAFEELGRDDLLARDPGLGPCVRRGLYFPNNGHTLSPERLMAAIFEAFTGASGTVLPARATGFELRDGRLAGIRTDGGLVRCDAAVLAAGAFSAALARGLGDTVPLETERGYHAMLAPGDGAPRFPTLDATAKIVATPMSAGVRITGTVELAGLAAAPDWRRARGLIERAAELFPRLAPANAAHPPGLWMGHRPSLPDSLPIIAPSRACRDVVLAFGHGHLGMTSAPKTAEIVTDLVAGRDPDIHLAPFAAERFRWRAA